jgi:hypothetical protein
MDQKDLANKIKLLQLERKKIEIEKDNKRNDFGFSTLKSQFYKPDI